MTIGTKNRKNTYMHRERWRDDGGGRRRITGEKERKGGRYAVGVSGDGWQLEFTHSFVYVYTTMKTSK